MTPEPPIANTARVTAFYARVTRPESLDKNLSIPNQIRRFEEMAARQEWTDTRVYAEDKPIDGRLPALKRPALMRLFKDADAGLIERVVFRHNDRMARGDNLMPLLTEIRNHGVALWTFDGPVDIETASGRLAVRVQAAVGAFEVERGGERVRDFRQGHAQKGIYVGPAPFGYTSQARIFRELLAAGMDKDEARTEAQKRVPVVPGLVVDAVEAVVVKAIFDYYVVNGYGTRRIAALLNGRGMLRRGTRWAGSLVAKTLRDPKVAGWTTYDEDAFRERRASAAPIHKQTRYEAQHEAIIDRDIWARAQTLLDRRREQLGIWGSNTRVYPLSGVLQCPTGHRMKGKSSGRGDHASYLCGPRSRVGTDPALGGCDASPVTASRAETAVRTVLAQVLGSPDTIMRALKSAQRQLAQEAPQRVQALADLDDEVAGLEREREGASLGFRDENLTKEQARAIADRLHEIGERLRGLRAKRLEVEHQSAALSAPQVSEEAVAAFLKDLGDRLGDDTLRFRDLILTLRDRHGLCIIALDAYTLNISMRLNPTVHAGPAGQGRVEAQVRPCIPLTLQAEFGARPQTAEEWAAQENNRGHYCACGCAGRIEVKPYHRAPTVGIPRFIHGHGKMDMSAFVEALNGDGYVTVAQAAARLGIGTNTLRRAESRGWICPQWRKWGDREPMRVYREADLATVKAKMADAGFRFRSDKEVLPTGEMARQLGVSETHLRWLERTGVIPKADRDSADRRVWRKPDVLVLRGLLTKARDRRGAGRKKV